MKKILLILILNASLMEAGTTYYSQGSVDPTVTYNWNSNRGGGGSSPANFTLGDVFVIQNGHTMTTGAAWAVSGTGNTIQIENGGVLTSTFLISCTKFQIDNGGTFYLNYSTGTNGAAGDIPGSSAANRVFGASSTVEIQKWGDGSGAPTNTIPSGVSWGNLTINISNLGGNWQFTGALTTIQGNLTIASTNSKIIRLSTSANLTLTIGGDFIIQNGTLDFASSAGSSTTRIMNIGGSFNQTGGTFQCSGTSNPLTINFTGVSKSYVQSAGTLTGTNINWTIASGGSLTLNNNIAVEASRSLTVSGSLTCGTIVVSGTGTFSLSSGGTLKCGHANGLNGNITSSTANYDAAANFEFNGSSSQVTGAAFVSANNLTINNSSGVTLSTNAQVTGTLTLTTGLFTLGSNSLSLGNSASVSGSLSASNMIVATSSGYLTKSFSGTGSFTFPVGDNSGTAEYSPATLNFTSGTFSSATASVNLSNSKHSNNSSSTSYIVRYWSVATSGISSFSCDVTFTYVDGDIHGTESNIYLGKYSSGAWTLLSAANTSSNELTGTVTSFSDFTGGESGALPVELVSFIVYSIGSKVELNWQTATEVNNYGFDVQRSAVSGQQSGWISIGFVKGNGNSNSPKNYSFTDQPKGGKEFKYRLKQIDFNGAFEYSDEVTAILENINSYRLDQNYPNPFNPVTRISYTIPQKSYVRLRVYDMLAKEIVELVNKSQDAGRYEVTFDGNNLPSGAYFYKLEAGNYIEVKKLLLVK